MNRRRGREIGSRMRSPTDIQPSDIVNHDSFASRASPFLVENARWVPRGQLTFRQLIKTHRQPAFAVEPVQQTKDPRARAISVPATARQAVVAKGRTQCRVTSFLFH